MANIHTSIICKNIAPLVDLKYNISSSSLKFAIFANNGSGKTFISRLFRLLENDETLLIDGAGNNITDAYLTYGKTIGEFSLNISDDISCRENLRINLEQGTKPIIPTSNYIYHTFNQDYVDKNIRELDYIKDAADENMQGFILGKAHIDVSDDKKKLEDFKQLWQSKQQEIITNIDNYKLNHISQIANITRLNEYKILESATILQWDGKQLYELEKTVEDYIKDFDKIKSIPENLPFIPEISISHIDDNRIAVIQEMLSTAYSLSHFKDDFKSKIKDKQVFIEDGLRLSNENICPFCERPYDDQAIELIDLYTEYITDNEASVIKQLDAHYKYLLDFISKLKEMDKQSDKVIKSFNDYKTRYIVSLENVTLHEYDINAAISYIEQILSLLNEKKKNISIPHILSDDLLSSFRSTLILVVDTINENNKMVKLMNKKIERISEENKSARKSICKAAYNYLCLTNKKNIEDINSIIIECKQLEEDIAKKEHAMRTLKKHEVANTIKKVLEFFFDKDKFTLDEETFQLVFQKRILDKGRIRYAISEGEKNIIAFAYYLGDTHVKISTDMDYSKMFFIIDDPISSLDFTYVYTISGIIRKIKTIFPKIEHPRYIILTHNNEFMRILCANKIVDKRLLLQNGTLCEFNTNYTVPYISHLLDVYRVARDGQTYNHTTANSIRHIMETLIKFQNIELNDDSIDKYIQKHFDQDNKTYTFINDLSHGGWRSDDEPLSQLDYQAVCESLIKHIQTIYPNQIKYCEKMVLK